MKKAFYLLAIGFGLHLCFSPKALADPVLTVDLFGLTTTAAVSTPLNLFVPKIPVLQVMPIFLRVQFPTDNYTAWGIELYTNNADGTWTPADGIYGGLREITTHQQKIPLFWQVYGNVQGNTTTAGALGLYPQTLQYWGRVFDRNDFDVAGNWLSPSNLRARTFMSYQGLGDFPSAGRIQVTSPVYVYLGMDVTGTVMQQFRSTLRLDLYNLNIKPSQGGYCTPNPFTPVRGQRTIFNFFTENYASPFIIRIYTIRGRQIRSITNIREWDGRNESGQYVEGGLYIYQIEAEKIRVSGTVVVIK